MLSYRIFEKIQWSDGGPNDRGNVIEYTYTINNEPPDAGMMCSWHEISKETFDQRKAEAFKQYQKFLIF